jgi:glycosyltransferase involved in cell wall biosynthesis
MRTSNKIAISVIIPVYNQEKYVGKCIQSVLGQSFQDFEVIIVNDGSTDKSLWICQKYAKRDGRIFIIDKQNVGVAQARKDGVLKACGEYICFLDSDDYLASDALEMLHELVTKQHVDMVVGNYNQVWDSWGIVKKKSVSYSKEFNDRVIAKSELTPLMLGFGGKKYYIWGLFVWGRLYRRDCIIRANEARGDILFPSSREIPSEDIWFNMAITPFLSSIWITNRVVYHYRYGGITTKDYPVIRRGGLLYDYRYDEIINSACEEVVLLQLFERYVFNLQRDVVNQVHFLTSTDSERREFILQEWKKRKIVQWLRQHSSELPVDMQKDTMVQSVLMGDVNSFLAAVYERERFLRMHHYWKMRILKNYQRIVDVFQ